MKWVSVATAPDQLVAEMWKDLLVAEGVPAALRPGDASTFLGVSAYPCRVMVPEDSLDRARDVMEAQGLRPEP
jgi:hypothetical protein